MNTGAIAVAALTYAFSNDLPGPDTRPAAANSARLVQTHQAGNTVAR